MAEWLAAASSAGWQWMVIGDAGRKEAWPTATPDTSTGTPPSRADLRGGRHPGGAAAARPPSTWPNFHLALLLLVPLIEGRLGEGLGTFAQARHWSSILQAVWSLMLALRERGLPAAEQTHWDQFGQS